MGENRNKHMAEPVQHPHDGLFRGVFSETAEAADLLRPALPAELRDELDWPTLSLEEGSFVDDGLCASESDLLFQIRRKGDGPPVGLYVLLEHQSTPDRWMPLRLLKYCCRIWEKRLREDPGLERLPPVLPVVFHQGRRGWTAAREFSELFPEGFREWRWTPRFEHLLLDDAKLGPERVWGGLKGRSARLVLMAASSEEHGPEALRMAAELLARLYAREGWEPLRLFMSYLVATQAQETVDLFMRRATSKEPTMQEHFVSCADAWLAEGEAIGIAKAKEELLAYADQLRAEGEQRGKAQVVEGLLSAGVGWEVVEQATGLDESEYRTLRERMVSRL